MSNRNMNDPDNAFQRALMAVRARVSRLESRAWPGAVRSASRSDPFTPVSAAPSTAIQLDVDRGRWVVHAMAEVAAPSFPANIEYFLAANPFEQGSSTPLNSNWHDLQPTTLIPALDAAAATMRIPMVVLGTIASEEPFTIALQMWSNLLSQPTWHNMKMVLSPS